ncbi:MAG: glycosyltransferase family A protein [Candidatus Limnocylindria bacterium]
MVLTCDRPQELAQMLAGLASQTVQISEIVVVNNSKVEEPTRATLERRSRSLSIPIIHLRGDPVFGTATGRNAGLAACTGEIVFLFDDDLVFPDARYVEKVCRVFDDDEERTIGAVTTSAEAPVAASYTTRVRRLLRRVGKAIFGMDGTRPGSVTRSGFQVSMPSGRVMDVDWLQSGVSALRGEVAQGVRFDTGLERRPLALSEDVEFGLHIRRRWRIVCLATTFAVNGHLKRRGTATQRLGDEARYELILRNYDRISRPSPTWAMNRLAYWRAMSGICLERFVALGLCRPRAVAAWRDYVGGLRAVVRGRDVVELPERRVKRELIDTGTRSTR